MSNDDAYAFQRWHQPAGRVPPVTPVATVTKNPHAVALGRRGGKVKSEAKAKTAKRNGKKGGRPKGS